MVRRFKYLPLLLASIGLMNPAFAETEVPETSLQPKLITPIQAIVPLSLQNTVMENPQVVAKVQVAGTGLVEDLVILEASHVGLISRAESLIRKALFDPGDFNIEESVRFDLVLGFQYPADLGATGKSVTDDVEILIDNVAGDDRAVGFYRPNELDMPIRITDQGTVYVPETDAGERIHGTARVEFYVNHLGEVRLPRIITSEDDEVSLAALASVKDMQFTRPMVDGKPAVTLVRMPFSSSPE